MTLPLAISVPHAGLWVPPEVKERCRLRPFEILEDGDVGAAEIYWPLQAQVRAFVTTGVARAIVDLNRPRHDRREDGAIKTHTCWGVPVYSGALPEAIAEALLQLHYDGYHRVLSSFPGTGARLAVDCHTMAAAGPPVGPDRGQARPAVCLSDGDGACPAAWFDALLRCFEQAFAPHEVRGNSPFRGGHIIRSHAPEMPWIQLELSRAGFLSNDEKRAAVHRALRDWCERPG